MGIGLRLEALMSEYGIKTNELAKKIGVTPSTLYSMIQRDSSRVDIDLLIKIAHALGITADELLAIPTPPFSNRLGVARDDEVKLIGNYRKLNDTGKEMSQVYVEDLAYNPKYTDKGDVSSNSDVG